MKMPPRLSFFCSLEKQLTAYQNDKSTVAITLQEEDKKDGN